MSQASKPGPESKPATGVDAVRRQDALADFTPNVLPPKTARLLQRRKSVSLVAREEARRSPAPREISLISEDGAVGYFLRRQHKILVVRREHRRPLGVCSTQSITLNGRAEFERWLSADTVRHEHPLIYDRLCAIGRDLLDAI